MKRTIRSELKSDGLKRGPWRPEEDDLLMKYIETHGVGRWSTISKNAGLMRCGKSCRLRWMNHLRPNIKHGQISPDEEDLIIRLHNLLGNRWALIAGRVPGRTDNDVKNYWNTYLSKKLAGKGTEPKTHDKSQLGLDVKGRPFCADLTGERDMKIDCIVRRASGAADTNTLTKDTHVSHKLDGCQFNSPEEMTAEPVNCFVNKDHSYALSDFHSLERLDSSANSIQDFVPNSAAPPNIITAPRPSIEWSKTHEASVSEKDNEAIMMTNIDKSVKPADELYNMGNILYDQINSNGLILDEISDLSIPAACGSEQNPDKFWESSLALSNNNHNNWFECSSIPFAGSYGMGDFINNYDFVYSEVRYEETRSVSDEHPLLIRSEL